MLTQATQRKTFTTSHAEDKNTNTIKHTASLIHPLVKNTRETHRLGTVSNVDLLQGA